MAGIPIWRGQFRRENPENGRLEALITDGDMEQWTSMENYANFGRSPPFDQLPWLGKPPTDDKRSVHEE